MYFLIGSCLGSFFCLVAHRVPQNKSILAPRSCCQNCFRSLTAIDLIPIVSILIHRFKCRRCQVAVSPIYLFSEIVYGIIFWYSFQQPNLSTQVLTLVWLTSAFVLSLADFFYFFIAPKLLYSSTILLWLTHLFFAMPFYWHSLLLIFPLSYWCLKEKLGWGDFILLFFWAPFLSPLQLSLLILLASFSGLIFFAFTFFMGKISKEIPFVPFLSVALFLVRFLLTSQQLPHF